MQDEFFKHNGMKLVLSCRMKFGDLYLSLVLEILVTMTFHNEAGELLKNDTSFMNDLGTYMKSNDENVQKNAKAIKWKLIGSEEKDIHGDTMRNQIMISYAHAQREIADKLYEQLQKDGFHVWINHQQLGDMFESIAHAIKSSKIVLICMSTAYNNSASCRLECQYAYKLGQRIIPIKVEKNFHPDGWLGMLVGGLLYVDFSKRDFQETYQQLSEVIKKSA